jgi:transcriptional regulator GlxA family with amidase domain
MHGQFVSSSRSMAVAGAIATCVDDNDPVEFATASRARTCHDEGMAKHVALLVADGFADSSLAIALDVLRTANALAVRSGRSPVFRIDVASARRGHVRSASGMRFETRRSVAVAARADIVLVPSLWVEDAAELDAALERPDVQCFVRAVRAAHARGAIVGAGCSGAFVLAEAGLLDGLEATTAWWLAPHLKKRRPQVIVNAERAFVVHGRVLCAGAVLALADLALHLVARFAGPTTARRCAGLLLLDTHTSQAPYMAVQHLAANDPTVRRAEAWVRAHLAEDFDVPTLARQVGTSHRTLARRLTEAVGVSAIGFIQRLRVESAVHLLATTQLPLSEISARVGYADPDTLSRLIERDTRTSPRELRRRHRTPAASAGPAAGSASSR